MANRRPPNNARRNDFQQRNDRSKNFGRAGVSPWQGGGPGAGLPNLLPLSGGSTEATLALASNLINLLQPRQNPVPSLLDMPIRRDFGPNVGRFDRGYNNNRMGNQNFRRTGNYNRSGDRNNTNRKNFRPNEGSKQQNKTTPKKEADSKAKPVKESSEEKKEETVTSEKKETSAEDQKEKKEPPKTRYDDINPQLLKCHICNKSMWDGRSFENHLNGRAHAIMMQKTAESYALTADTMRQEFKIREMKRTRKQGGGSISREFYCAMCDMYAAEGGAHRTTVGHRKLKKYLHPSCAACKKEMPTRIELDEHRLSAEHLRNMQDKQDIMTKPKPEVMVISTLSMEQSYVRDGQRRRKHHDDGKDKEDAANEDGESKKIKQEGEEMDTTENEKQENDAEAAANVDNEDTILDYVEGEDIGSITTERIPTYSTERGVGASFLAEFRCVQCKLCHKLLEDDAAAQVHLRTWRHHQLFTRMLADKAAKDQKPEVTQEEGEQESQPVNQKRALNCEESGNWKRRKTTPDPDVEDAGEHEDEEVNVKEEEVENNGENLEENLDGDGDQDQEMPSADDLEDWTQQQEDGIVNEEEQPQVKTEPEEEKPEEVEKPKEAEKPAPTTPSTPSGRATRGRGRGRGRRY